MLSTQVQVQNTPSNDTTHHAATLVQFKQPCHVISNMAGMPLFLSSCSMPNMTHSIFSSQLTSRPNISPSEWFIDIGAIDHMVTNTQFFTSMTVVTNVTVTLPNGHTFLVTHIGSNTLTGSLILTNVLCAPFFYFNLISVSKLTLSLHCCVFFISNYFFI